VVVDMELTVEAVEKRLEKGLSTVTHDVLVPSFGVDVALDLIRQLFVVSTSDEVIEYDVDDEVVEIVVESDERRFAVAV
jgi:hypothetical protein